MCIVVAFASGKLPPQVYQILRDHWEAGKEHAVVEPWSKSDCHTNFYEVFKTFNWKDIGTRCRERERICRKGRTSCDDDDDDDDA